MVASQAIPKLDGWKGTTPAKTLQSNLAVLRGIWGSGQFFIRTHRIMAKSLEIAEILFLLALIIARGSLL